MPGILCSLLNGNLNTLLSYVARHKNIFTAIREVLVSASNIKAVGGGSESNPTTGDYNTTTHTSYGSSSTQIFQPSLGSQNLSGGLGGPGGSGDPDPNKRGQLPTGHYIDVVYTGKVKTVKSRYNPTPEKRAEKNKRRVDARRRAREVNIARNIDRANNELENLRLERTLLLEERRNLSIERELVLSPMMPDENGDLRSDEFLNNELERIDNRTNEINTRLS